VVADELGTLFNKEALLGALLARSLPDALSHVAGLRSVVELKLARAPAAAGNGGANGGAKSMTAPARGQADFQPSNASDFQCPITGLEFNGRFRFSAHRPTGHVVSERALKEVPVAVAELIGRPYTPDEWFLINPAGEDLDRARERLAVAKLKRKDKKASKQQRAAAAAAGGDGEADGAGASGRGGADGAGAAAVAAAAEAGVGPAGGKLKRPHPELAAAAAAAAAAAGPSSAAAAAAAAAAADGGLAAKRAKASEKTMALMPKAATATVYGSLFASSKKGEEKESYLCRATSARGHAMS